MRLSKQKRAFLACVFGLPFIFVFAEVAGLIALSSFGQFCFILSGIILALLIGVAVVSSLTNFVIKD